VEFRKVIEAEPRHAAARRGEIVALLLTGRYGEARVRLQEALREFPQDAQLAHVQARLLATVPDPRVRDGRLALEIARRLAAARQDLRVRETLALALAEAGRFDEAVEVQRGVVGEAETRGDAGLVRDVRAKLEALARGEAWTAASADEILAATLGAS
jgi:tetratricopeptide (TPR) repeat protein